MQELQEKIMSAVNSGDAIPAGPMVMSRIVQLCRDPEATAHDLAKVIQLDGRLATQVLKLVNSSFYGLSSQVKTITHAVIILGFQEVKHLALSIPVARFFDESRNNGGINVNTLWERTLICSCIARALSYHIKHPIPEQVFVSSILSKSGMLILNNILGEDYAKVITGLENPERQPFVEKETFGINHIQLGWMLAKKWQFPQELLDAIAYQYNPAPKDSMIIEAGLIFAARRLLDGVQSDKSISESIIQMPGFLIAEFKLTAEAGQKALETASDEFNDVYRMLSGDSV